MEAYFQAFELLSKSIFTNDILILGAAVVTLVWFFLSIGTAKAIKIRTKDWKKTRNVKFSYFLCHSLSKFYTLFVTFISIFPLLGMFGTVIGLLGLDLTNGDMENIRSNFFVALTSTAWGIIFSVLFKVIHALIADSVEEQIEMSKKLADDLENL